MEKILMIILSCSLVFLLMFVTAVILFMVFYQILKPLMEKSNKNDKKSKMIEYVNQELKEGEIRKIKHKSKKEFIMDLENRGSFYAQFKDSSKAHILITYKYNGEEEVIDYETLFPEDFYEDYVFAREK